jgi:hypothetical protein
MTTLERTLAKHKTFADDVTKLALKRDKALDALMRAETRYRAATRAVSRSQKRVDKMRALAAEIRAAKKARAAAPGKSAEDVLTV